MLSKIPKYQNVIHFKVVKKYLIDLVPTVGFTLLNKHKIFFLFSPLTWYYYCMLEYQNNGILFFSFFRWPCPFLCVNTMSYRVVYYGIKSPQDVCMYTPVVIYWLIKNKKLLNLINKNYPKIFLIWMRIKYKKYTYIGHIYITMAVWEYS